LRFRNIASNRAAAHGHAADDANAADDGGLRSAKEPIPVWCELLNEAARERAIAPPALPEIHGMGGEFGRAVFGIFAEFEAMLLRTIEPEHDSFTDLDRLVLMSEFHSAFQILEVRCHCLFDRFPSRLAGLDVPTCTRARVQVVQVERH
jgi:hypothetical protein